MPRRPCGRRRSHRRTTAAQVVRAGLSRAGCPARRWAGRGPPTRGSRGSAGDRAPTARGHLGSRAARRGHRSRRGSAAPSTPGHRRGERRTPRRSRPPDPRPTPRRSRPPRPVRRPRDRPATSRRGTGTPACEPLERSAVLQHRSPRPGAVPGPAQEPHSSRPHSRRPPPRHRWAPPLRSPPTARVHERPVFDNFRCCFRHTEGCSRAAHKAACMGYPPLSLAS